MLITFVVWLNEVLSAKWADVLINYYGFTSDPTDGCECLYRTFGGVFRIVVRLFA